MSETRTTASTPPETDPVEPTADDLEIVEQDTGEYLVKEAALKAAREREHGETAEPSRADGPDRVSVGSGDVEVDCPGCGLSVVGEAPRPTAAWFCPRCDYPLFWVSEPPAPNPPDRRARRRLPGTGGTEVLGAETCWHCGEMNEPGDGECIRCAATVPKPVPPAVPVVEIRVPVRTPVPVRFVTWPYIAAAACAGSSVAMTLTLWIAGG